MLSGYRESAFVHAIAAAGIAYSVTRRCRSGQLAGCGCDLTARPSPSDSASSAEGEMRWAGCSDNVDYGVAFSRQFSDRLSARRKSSIKRQVVERRLVNLHNAETGRMVCFFYVSVFSSVFPACLIVLTNFQTFWDNDHFLHNVSIKLELAALVTKF